jgi:hypothetical protein
MSRITVNGETRTCTINDLRRWDTEVAEKKFKTREDAAAADLAPKKKATPPKKEEV